MRCIKKPLAVIVIVLVGLMALSLICRQPSISLSSVQFTTARGVTLAEAPVLNQLLKRLGAIEHKSYRDKHSVLGQPVLSLSAQRSDGSAYLRRFYLPANHKSVVVENPRAERFYTLDDQRLAEQLDNLILETQLANYSQSTMTIALRQSDIRLLPQQSIWQVEDLQGATLSKSAQSAQLNQTIKLTDTERHLQLQLGEELGEADVTLYAERFGITYPIELDPQRRFQPLALAGVTQYFVKVNARLTEPDRPTLSGESSYQFNLDVTAPPQLWIEQHSQPQGGFFLIKGRYLLPSDRLIVKTTLSDETYQVLADQYGESHLVIPLNYWSPSGDYLLTASLLRGERHFDLPSFPLTVSDRHFAMQYLQVAKSVESTTRSDAAYDEYNSKFMPVRRVSADQKLWQGAFIMPLQGRLTTDYGTRRTVNDAPTNYRHNGIDIAAPAGTPVQAANRGKVVFADYLQLTGNTVVLDHGKGFFSYYLHMQEIDVAFGQLVEKAQPIGKVGSTGFSTGPHLHFTTSYYLTNIDPFQLLKWDGEW